ncbi:hypothetical protein CDES_11165 [Corynebacterium deserti GIMN1.010]|uniref:HTH hxlR-type domain-containing protein n=1 Tax=Corynebacterium deserti GIMN1.010 TaxID=931089 RepID=A0A0M3QA33_9CORY|nr:winged helix-turn-helix transcriptional regulator [Corynebacterium deserti]ALC06603.1 hypothetical protein CDES_11165 [Corynebacterium deserti GIMN1.010]
MCRRPSESNEISDPWILPVIRDVLCGQGRFDRLRDNLGISEAVLSRQLRDLEDAGLLERKEYKNAFRRHRGYGPPVDPAATRHLG